MDNINNTPKKTLKIKKEITPIILTTNQSPFNNKLKYLHLDNYNKYYNNFKNNDFILSKNKIFSNNLYNINKNQNSSSSKISKKDFSSQYPLKLPKGNTIELHYNNKLSKNIGREFEIGILGSITERNHKNKLKLLKKLMNFSKINNNLEDINYILESPHRGVEKMGISLTKTISKDKNVYHPAFINNNYKRYFYIKKLRKSKTSSILTNKNNNKKFIIDKYNETKRNKKIDNPLKRLSKISGVSCSKLRKVIDYSLSHRIKNFRNFIGDKLINDNNKSRILSYVDNNYNSKSNNKSNNNKCIYTMISLKSKQKNNLEKNKINSLNIDNGISSINSIRSNYFKRRIQKRYNNSFMHCKKDNNPFNNLTIKDKIEDFKK